MSYRCQEIMRIMDLIEESGEFEGLSHIELRLMATQILNDQHNPNHYDPKEGVRY